MRYLPLLLLAGCSTIGDVKPPADWPQLQVKVNHVGFWQMQEKCGINPLLVVTVGYVCFGYTEVDFCSKTCNVTHHTNLMLSHEKDGHCAGFDHPNSTHFRDQWEWHKRLKRNHECAFNMGRARYCSIWPEDKELCQ